MVPEPQDESTLLTKSEIFQLYAKALFSTITCWSVVVLKKHEELLTFHTKTGRKIVLGI